MFVFEAEFFDHSYFSRPVCFHKCSERVVKYNVESEDGADEQPQVAERHAQSLVKHLDNKSEEYINVQVDQIVERTNKAGAC